MRRRSVLKMTIDDVLYPVGGIIGVDPGRSSGAVAYIYSKNGSVVGTAWPIEKMTERDTWDLIRQLAAGAILAVLEQVHGMNPAGRKSGSVSSFKFGCSYGELRMALVASGVRLERVTPLKWQRALSCQSKGDKNITKTKAQELFGGMKITHKTADALLLAEYGRRFLL